MSEWKEDFTVSWSSLSSDVAPDSAAGGEAKPGAVTGTDVGDDIAARVTGIAVTDVGGGDPSSLGLDSMCLSTLPDDASMMANSKVKLRGPGGVTSSCISMSMEKKHD